MGKVKGVLVDVNTNKIEVKTIDNKLEDYYKILNCDTFDIASVKIGDTVFDVYCDDCGLLKENPIPSAYDKDHNIKLVGNLFFTKTDMEGDTISLTESEIQQIMDAKVRVFKYNEENLDLFNTRVAILTDSY